MSCPYSFAERPTIDYHRALANNSHVRQLSRRMVKDSTSHPFTNAAAIQEFFDQNGHMVQASKDSARSESFTPKYYTCSSGMMEEYDGAKVRVLSQRIEERITSHVVQATAVVTGLPTINLDQASFNTGTYRIKTPGIYNFTSDVVFSANTLKNNNRADLPNSGDWFTALSIECDGLVVLQGNGKKFSQSTADAASSPTGAFSLITLGNALFAGALFGVGNANYPETVATGFRNANNIIISGFLFLTSSHFAIRGCMNDNVNISGCTFTDHQIGSISLQSATNLTIDLCLFNGSTSPVQVLIASSSGHTFKQILAQFVSMGIPGAADYLSGLNRYMAAKANQARFTTPQRQTSAHYAISLAAGVAPIFTFPNNGTENAVGTAIGGGYAGNNIRITNCLFTGFSCRPVEMVSIGTNIPTDPIGIPLSTLPLFGTAGSLEWKDAFDSTGAFNPNAFLQALTFVVSIIYSGLDAGTLSLLPSNAQTIFNSILTKNATQFFSNAAPIVGAGADLNPMKGLFGIRVVGCTNLVLEGLVMDTFENYGVLTNPTTLPGYSRVLQPHPLIRFRGNDSWFFDFEVCNGVTIRNCAVSRMKTGRGYSFGIDLPSEDSNVAISNVTITNVSSPNTVDTPTVHPGDTFGINVENETGPIAISNVVAIGLTAGGEVFPFPMASSTITLTNVRNL